ncbi:Swarming motility protein SwrB [Bacillus atrophaeus]|uniref:DUF6115 domain-containing protein n=1 Tax=Bacillus atrophaeus TaxID=1452 RepID=UPI001C630AF7|nr:Swarming motility protein SwrB [Bacillus atrophaeus]MCY8909012.1 Swarming motility protein SwrB [Bacillus atrophaeus]MCY9109203.1 Swarming motility protein SwrB [Bacillus atrophaeus]MEC0838559.1 Swarming motility protein SwrB [Bacillus atrophaeus]MEC0847502.1 Swarming motility protein SwrB [Bacillus atrophaeus]MEC0848631.1 Swarming motility protein SwrB [Bacillus atrophaeus]
MSTLLWLLSFMLHGVLLYAVIILYTKLAALKETERQQKKILEETENTLAAFLLELKEENEKLIEHPVDLSAGKDGAGQEKKTPQSSGEKAETAPEPEETPIPAHIQGLISEVEQAEDSMNSGGRSFEDQVIELYDQGFSAGEIARKLKSGKTEIELFLKFRAKAVKDS